MIRRCCRHRPSLRTTAHDGFPQLTKKFAGQVRYLSCHRTWALVSQKNPSLASSVRLTPSSTAAAAIARTALVDFTSKNPTCKSFGFITSCRRLISQQGILFLLPFGPRELPRPLTPTFRPITPLRSLPPNTTNLNPSLEQNIGIAVASMPALRQLLLTRKKSHPSRTSEPLCKHHKNAIRPPLHPFAKFSDSDLVRLSDDDFPTEISSCKEFPTPTPRMTDIEGCHNTRASLIRLSMVPPPLWTKRKKTSVEKVEMSPVSPTPTLVEREPLASSAEQVRPSTGAPSWGHGKISSADRAYTLNDRRLGMVAPLSIDRPPSPLVAGRVQPLGKFEETGLRHSRVATLEEMMSLENPAAMGSSCRIDGKRRKGTPKTSPKLP